MKFLIRIWAKWWYYLGLERDAAKAEMEAKFIAWGVVDMQQLIKQTEVEVVRLQYAFDGLVDEHEYEKRKKRGEIGNEIAEKKASVENYKSAVTTIEKTAQSYRQKAAELRVRSKFIRTRC